MDTRQRMPEWRLVGGLIVLVGLGVLSGCASAVNGSPSKTESQPGHALLGRTRDEIVACAGAPLEERRQEGLTVLTYYREASALEQDFPQAKSSFPKAHHGCRARLGLRGDRVEGVEFEAVPEDAFNDHRHCDDMFQACVAPP